MLFIWSINLEITFSWFGFTKVTSQVIIVLHLLLSPLDHNNQVCVHWTFPVKNRIVNMTRTKDSLLVCLWSYVGYASLLWHIYVLVLLQHLVMIKHNKWSPWTYNQLLHIIGVILKEVLYLINYVPISSLKWPYHL